MGVYFDNDGNYIKNNPIKPLTNTNNQFSFEPIPVDQQESISQDMPSFDSEATYTPTTVLQDNNAMNVIRKYMKDFEGIDKKTTSDEDIVEMYLVRMRKFAAGQSVVSGAELLQLAKASETKLANAGRAYDVFDRFEGVFSEDYTWGEMFEGLGTYARAVVVDPTNLVGLGVGRVVGAVATKATTTAMKAVATKAGLAAVKRETTKRLKAAGTKKKLKNVLTETETKNIMKAASQKSIEKQLKSASVTTALKSGVKKEIAAATATDAVLALGVDYAYQSGMIMTGQQESWSPFQSGLTALGVLGGGLLSGGLALTEKATRSAKQRLGEKTVTLTERAYGVDVQKVVAKAEAKKLEKVDKAKFKTDIEKLLKSFNPEKDLDLQASIVKGRKGRGRITKEGRELLYNDNFYRHFMLGREAVGNLPAVKGFAEILVDNNIKMYGPRYAGDNVTSFVADILEAMPQDLAKEMTANIQKTLPKKLGVNYSKYTNRDLADIFVAKQSTAGANLQISSELAKKISVSPKMAERVNEELAKNISYKNYLDDINPDIERTVLTGQSTKNISYYQNFTIQAIVSNPATTALNIIGSTYRGGMDSFADVIKGGLYTTVGLKGIVTGDYTLLNKGTHLFRVQGKRIGNLVAPQSTKQQVESYMAMRPEVEDKLFRYLSGGVDNKALLEEFGINAAERFDIRFAEKYKDFFQKLYLVRAQDNFFKTQNFMYYLEKNIRDQYGVTYQQFLKQDKIKLAQTMATKEYRALEFKALDDTAQSVFAKSYSSKKTFSEYTKDPLSFAATTVEELRKVPIIGITVPFGQFFNGTVDFMSQYTGAKLIMRTIGGATATAKGGYKQLKEIDADTTLSASKKALMKEKISKEFGTVSLDEYVELSTKAAAGWVVMWNLSDNEMSYVEQNLSWKEERTNDGSIQSKEYDFPESFFKFGARAIAYWRLGREMPDDFITQGLDTFSYQALLRTLGKNVKDVGELGTDLYENPLDLVENLYNISANLGSSFVSGATRPLDPINQFVGYAKGSNQISLDRKQGYKNLNNSLRYVDQIITPMLTALGSEEKESATTQDKSQTLGRLIGYRQNVAQSDTEKMFNSIEKPTWKTDIYSDAPKADNRLNAIIAPILEAEASRVINRRNFNKISLDDRKYLVSKALKTAKKRAIDQLKRSSIVEDRQLIAVFKLYETHSNTKIEAAMKELNLKGDPIDLDEGQLRELNNYIKGSGERQERRISRF